MSEAILTWTTLSDDAERAAAAHRLLAACHEADGVEAFSEQFVLGIDDARLEHRHLVAEIDGELAGVAAVTGTDVELAVAPRYRRRGVGTRLIHEVQAGIDDAAFWAHGNLEAAAELTQGEEMTTVRRLLVMSVDGVQLEDTSSEVPEGYVVTNLAEASERYGRDFAERAWLEVNNDAFSWHPEQGGWDMERLHRSQEVDWYSDEDVLLLWEAPAGDQRPQLAGFHWTKWQSGNDGADDHRQGEVYVVGLANAYRGKGLGGPVVEIGLAHLRAGGAREVILYVEDDNEAAVRRYEKIGFRIAEEHVVYAKRG
ncbi:mycothiol synthase [Corynebacterium yudongzhengii]|uniref:Mycothiol acetyltransferase n=1 Tax=Corynebacterium yudongzhengii TaxID=2080740 RepID=A0A2U1T602_9CORY|nr:mycothiol synthase [Corynebacterium yudongzhengii]AWB82584.1 mycothiol synthase [Corynebacterium yudongzhengii]PWC01318.1 mycothiol synthase [Corynebacterium yudongzhengii]